MKDIEKIERTILGSIIFAPQDHLKVFSLIKSEHFEVSVHRTVFDALGRLNSKNCPIEHFHLANELKLMGQLENIGGDYFLSALTDFKIFHSLDKLCLLVVENYLKREIERLGMYLQNRVLDTGLDVFELIAETESKLTSLLKGAGNVTIEQVGPIKEKVLNEIESVITSGKKSGVLCSVDRLNNQTSGWQKSDLIVLAGRPGMGKTSAAVDFVLQPSLNGIPTAFFSLEMSKEQLTGRMLSIISGMNVQKIINKNMDAGDLLALRSHGQGLNGVPLFIDDTPALSLFDLKNRARVLKRESKIELIVIDYLQLMTIKTKGGNREQEISEISRGLKALAKELDIPIIALSQLSRKCEERPDKKPMLSDLRESGAIEQDADIVIFCYRPEYYDFERYQLGKEEIDTQGLFMFIIAKFRNGSPGEVRAKFIHENTMITNYQSF